MTAKTPSTHDGDVKETYDKMINVDFDSYFVSGPTSVYEEYLVAHSADGLWPNDYSVANLLSAGSLWNTWNLNP